MARTLTLLAFLLFGLTAYAQDVDFGAFGDAGSLLGPTAPAARGATAGRGAPTARGAAPAPPPDRLVRLRDALAKAEAPLTKEQEADLNKLLEAEIPEMRRTLQTHGQQMMAARPANATPPAASQSSPPPQPTAPAAGAPNPALLNAVLAARGAPPSSRVPAEVLDALEVEMRQMNDALFTRIAAAPALTPAQQSVLTRMSRGQIKSRGGFDAIRITLEDAGAAFTPDQLPKVQALFEDQKTSRAALAKESQGTPDPTALKQLDRDTLTKVLGILIPAQRTALLATLRTQ